jgi:nitroreductase
MDVFEAVNSRIACRHFLDKPVDLGVVRKLIEGASRAASNSNVQPWNVHALTGEPLRELRQRVADAITHQDWRTYEAEFPDLPPNMAEPYRSRTAGFGAQLYGALGIKREDRADRFEQIKRNYRFFNAPVGLFITIDRHLGHAQWADLGGYINTLAFLARGHGLDTCPQILWSRLHSVVRPFLQLPPEQILFCGMGVGYGDRSHPVNCFRTRRAELHEFCKFYGFD